MISPFATRQWASVSFIHSASLAWRSPSGIAASLRGSKCGTPRQPVKSWPLKSGEKPRGTSTWAWDSAGLNRASQHTASRTKEIRTRLLLEETLADVTAHSLRAAGALGQFIYTRFATLAIRHVTRIPKNR